MKLVECSAVIAQQQGEAPGQPGIGGALMQFAPIILIIVVFFWLMSHSQRKKERKREEMLDGIKPKDKVTTIGGIHGRVVSVKDDSFVVRIDDKNDVTITISKTGVSGKLGDSSEPQS